MIEKAKITSSFASKRNSKLSYSQIMNKIEEQKKLVAEGKKEKRKPVNGFTLEDWKEFERGISIEKYAVKCAIGY